ncbi:hypothetical protein JTE90_026983, partial [Oedothorax gibbosus]
MALKTLLIKHFPKICTNIESVTATTDLNVLSIYNSNDELLVYLLKSPSTSVSFSNVVSFAWLEDNYNQIDYRIIIINKEKEICYYSICIKDTENAQVPSLEKTLLSRWRVQNIFQSFQELAKSLGEISSIQILRFESKEVILVFDGKVVVSFYPSNEVFPTIMSIVDLRENSPSHKKVLLLKDVLFALNDCGTKIYIYSFINNTKLKELEFSDYSSKSKQDLSVHTFTVNLKLNLLIFISDDGQIFSMTFDLSSHPNPKSQMGSTITAFTKHYPSVGRLNEKWRRYSTSSSCIQPLSFSCDTEGLVLKDLVIVENKLCFWYSDELVSVVGIHVLDSDRPTLCQRLPQPSFLIKSGSEEVPFPLLMFSDDKIFLVLYNLEQDKLVNELMIYPSSGAVETLSSLNNWNSIHMDIEVLKLGLSNRQLYTVEFFLKTLFEGFCQLWNSAISEQWKVKVEKDCSLWDEILNLVLENVYNNITDSYSCQYAEQLLQVLIKMVIQIISVVESKKIEEDNFNESDKNFFLDTFSKSLFKMRKLLRESEFGNADASDSEENGTSLKDYSEKVSNQWKKWEQLSKEEVIHDSILSGNIPLAQSFLSLHNKDASSVSYADFETAAEDLLLSYLRQGLMEESLNILLNMGIDINCKLLDIFKSTPERDIRALMLKELQERDLLTQEDLQSLQFISLLENLYPCTSFQHAQLLMDEKSMLKEDTLCAKPVHKGTLQVGDFSDFNQDNSESGSYCRIVLNWLLSWDSDIKGRILSPHYLKNSPVLDYFIKEDTFEIDKMSVWCYLLENGNLPYLMNWVDIWLGIHPQNSDCFSALDKWPLTGEMINLIPEKAASHVSETLLNALARQGIFCEEELENISLFLSRIGRSQCDINDMAIFTSEKACISFSDLCHRLVHYCLKHNLVHYLFTFLSNNYKKFTVWPSCQLCNVPLLNLTKAFYRWSQNYNDSLIAYEAVASAAQYVFQLPNISSSEILCNVPLPLSVAVLLFKPQSLSTSVKEVLSLSSAEAVQNLKAKFRAHPLLYNFLFKTSEERDQPDITVYELLKGTTKFDTSQLFGWQSANSLKSEDSLNELPHFSLKSLSEQYGLKKELTYLYYLTEGRPNYSYLKFIAQEVVLETGLSISRVRAACRDVTDYALSNYKSSDICAACICFVELLGQDSLPLRMCLVAANMLHEAQIPESDAEYEKNCLEIGRKFKQAYASRDAAVALISEMEQIVLNSWNPFNTDTNALFNDLILWMPVMSLSHLFEVEAGNTYLYECGKQNDWLKFLVFSQIFQIPKEQILKATSRFSNSCISYHIFHSLHRTSSLLFDVAYETKTVPTLKTPKKDTRKSWYTRIGVIKKTQKSPAADAKKPTSQEEDNVSITSEETSNSSDVDLRSFVLKDLFSQLLLANNSDSPKDCLLHTSFEIKNPILALISASYPDARLENCFFVWLYTTLWHSREISKQLESSFPEINVTNCSTDDLDNLIILSVQNLKILTLWQGVHLFLPNTPLPSLLGFLRSFMVYKKFDSTIESFQNALWDYPKHFEKSSVIQSRHWIEHLCVCILKEAVIACSTSYERHTMLQHFHHTQIEKTFSAEVKIPGYMKVYKMVQCLGESVQDVDIKNLFLAENNPTYTSTCWDAVKKLLICHLYEEAQMFATAAKLPQEEMLMLQINHETDETRKSANWDSLPFRVKFWGNMLPRLKVLRLYTAVDFLEVQCEISDKFGEKYFLLKSVIDLIKESKESGRIEADSYNLEVLNRKMWWWCIKAEVNYELIPEIFDVKSLHTFHMEDAFSPVNVPSASCCIDDKLEQEALSSIMGQFLQKKDLQKAFELATTFNYECSDLQVIKTCLELATKTVDLDAIDFSSPNNIPEVPSSRTIRSLVLWVASVTEGPLYEKKHIIQSMKKLSKKCTIGTTICYQILVHFTVASVLNVTYESIAKEKDAFDMLKNILVLKLNDKHVLAKSLIVVHELGDMEVAKFLTEEIWYSLLVLGSTNLVMIPEDKNAFSEQVIYDPLRANEGFQLIVKLCQDPSFLGNYLMNKFSSEASELTDKSSDQSFTILVDLLICAHECFTAACNMDGISEILHSALMLVNLLEEADKFLIMVHLLTGLGRYSEMMYVFDILKSHDKLNILFEKQIAD